MIGNETMIAAIRVDDAGKLADTVGANLQLTIEEKQELLEIFDPIDRLTRVAEMLDSDAVERVLIELDAFHAAFEAGAHPANTGKPEFANGPRGARLAEALGLDMDARSAAPRRAIEVYPHAATVALFRLERTLKYKAKPGRTLERLKSELLLLMDGVERLADTGVPVHVAGHPDWVGLRKQVTTAQRKSELRRAEDPVDAVVCAYVALYAQRCPGRITIYGDAASGYIVTPSLPPELTAP